ncbi:MAG: tyrosine-protein phosphatase [Methyloligellaceae bacterium]
MPRVYFHCSAGIHRTGFFVYLLLRFRGLNGDQAYDGLKDLRPVTAEQVGEERLELADNLIAKHFSG